MYILMIRTLWCEKGAKSDSYKSLIINGHMDVAEVSADEAWKQIRLPFIKDGWLVGRGAADMKGD